MEKIYNLFVPRLICEDLHNEMYQFVEGSEGWAYYDILGIIFILICFVSALFFYKIFDKASGNRTTAWLTQLIITAVINFAIAALWIHGRNGDPHNWDIETFFIFGFGIVNFTLAAVYFLIFSFIFKNISINNIHTPFKFPNK
ncbi:MAG: hypothetical protein LBC85_00915 [Fibromonadaceae bacterium]|jgi:chromate transport protein ChrA|nr:hypothetical protein [Fibromonadaceae bacterium]